MAKILRMNRKEFLTKGLAATTTAAIAPYKLFGKEARQRNNMLFSKPLKPTINGEWKEFHLYITIAEHELVLGKKVHTLAFNGQIPGPEIRVNAGDKVRVFFENRTELNHTIHWHGLYVPWRMDGVPFLTQMPVRPGTTFKYEFTAKPFGTHFYHCHWSTMLHMQSGMFGPIIIEDPDDPVKKEFPYDRDYTLVYSQHDVNFMRESLNDMLNRMKQRTFLMKKGDVDPERFGIFDNYDQLKKHVEHGYQPPYLNNRRSPDGLPVPNYFLVNGKAYPDAPIVYIKEGERIRLRLINAGMKEHYLHLHGHDFWEVANDGRPIKYPQQMNTVRLSPGKTSDIIIEGDNRGLWAFHDHDSRGSTNNGLYPGGTFTFLAYEDLPEHEREVEMMMGNMKMKKKLPIIDLDE